MDMLFFLLILPILICLFPGFIVHIVMFLALTDATPADDPAWEKECKRKAELFGFSAFIVSLTLFAIALLATRPVMLLSTYLVPVSALFVLQIFFSFLAVKNLKKSGQRIGPIVLLQSFLGFLFCFTRCPQEIGPRLCKEAGSMRRQQRPTATSAQNFSLISKAAPQRLKDYGRLPDASFEPLWKKRIALTEQQLLTLLKSILLERSGFNRRTRPILGYA